jgi:hypothetical protein
MNTGDPISQNTQEMLEKLAYISIEIATTVPASNVSFEDAYAIKVAAEIAVQWINNDPLIKDLKHSGL